ncbi:cupin domain-containing protein [Streptosporangium sp. NPDC000396]|uniref:cupin domain-containing protein n=1 Tax=Streptosporangium sp. NPDC000396 TaxID=3366185 RepID=UPI003686391A
MLSRLLVVLPLLLTPASSGGVTGVALARGVSPGPISVTSGGRTDVVVRRVVIEPGGSTGWHRHAGRLIAVVRRGVLTHTLSDCSTRTDRAGTAFVEPAHEVHEGRNLGTEPVVLLVTYVLPAGSPLSQDAPAPACSGKS